MNHNSPLFRTLLLIIILFSFNRVSAQPKKSLLWQISGKGISQPAYLYGTVHLFDTTRYKLPETVFSKLKSVKKVYFELDFGRINPSEMMQSLWVKDSSQYLSRLLDTASLNKLNQLAQTSPVLKAMGGKLYQIKPFYVSAFLLTGSKAVSLDMELYKAATGLKDSTGGIETVSEQLAAVDAVPLDAQAKMLAGMLRTYTSANTIIENSTKIYVRQDLDRMLEELNKEMPIDASFNTELVDKRNVIMASRIDHMLGKGSIMIAVGAGHLGGKAGLIDLLKKKGYSLTAVPFAFQKR